MTSDAGWPTSQRERGRSGSGPTARWLSPTQSAPIIGLDFNGHDAHATLKTTGAKGYAYAASDQNPTVENARAGEGLIRLGRTKKGTGSGLT